MEGNGRAVGGRGEISETARIQEGGRKGGKGGREEGVEGLKDVLTSVNLY